MTLIEALSVAALGVRVRIPAWTAGKWLVRGQLKGVYWFEYETTRHKSKVPAWFLESDEARKSEWEAEEVKRA